MDNNIPTTGYIIGDIVHVDTHLFNRTIAGKILRYTDKNHIDIGYRKGCNLYRIYNTHINDIIKIINKSNMY